MEKYIAKVGLEIQMKRNGWGYIYPFDADGSHLTVDTTLFTADSSTLTVDATVY